jgi:hypothetical protein
LVKPMSVVVVTVSLVVVAVVMVMVVVPAGSEGRRWMGIDHAADASV